MQKITENLNNTIEAVLSNEEIPLGLAQGKMGLSIYFYRLARLENNEKHSQIAERLLDEIFERISQVKSIDIEHGLSGIGLGISYLIKNGYVRGDENEILRDVDDELFKQVSFLTPSNQHVTVLIQILLYISIRKRSLRGEQAYLFDELVIQIINTLHTKIDRVLQDDAIAFNLQSNLPLFLFALSKIYESGIYNEKIERIIREITPFILSKFGYPDSKRLYLLWGIGKINRCIQDERLTEHCRLLASRIDFDNLLDEFRNKNMFLKHGLAGICLLMLTLEDDARQNFDTDTFYAEAKKRMENSLIWELSTDKEQLTADIGLSGYCGLISIYHALTR